MTCYWFNEVIPLQHIFSLSSSNTTTTKNHINWKFDVASCLYIFILSQPPALCVEQHFFYIYNKFLPTIFACTNAKRLKKADLLFYFLQQNGYRYRRNGRRNDDERKKRAYCFKQFDRTQKKVGISSLQTTDVFRQNIRCARSNYSNFFSSLLPFLFQHNLLL